jgi:glucose/arabinose dehydrogenase
VSGGARRTRLARFTVDLARDAYRADPASELVILEQPQPYSNHNGGAVRFGPDGMLYLGLGDGGSEGDPQGNGQDLGNWLSTIIRIDVRHASAAQPYVVPPDNPFVGTAGAKPEIWAYGLRNPWRMSFDSATGALWVGDVGQDRFEEVDVVRRGGNYGWSHVEGFSCYKPSTNCGIADTVPPLVVYPHGPECSISGGVVYRGRAIPALDGHYLYGDYCSGAVWALDASTRANPVRLATGVGNVVAFGTDAAGEVYVLTFGAPVLKVVPR